MVPPVGPANPARPGVVAEAEAVGGVDVAKEREVPDPRRRVRAGPVHHVVRAAPEEPGRTGGAGGQGREGRPLDPVPEGDAPQGARPVAVVARIAGGGVHRADGPGLLHEHGVAEPGAPPVDPVRLAGQAAVRKGVLGGRGGPARPGDEPPPCESQRRAVNDHGPVGPDAEDQVVPAEVVAVQVEHRVQAQGHLLSQVGRRPLPGKVHRVPPVHKEPKARVGKLGPAGQGFQRRVAVQAALLGPLQAAQHPLRVRALLRQQRGLEAEVLRGVARHG